MKNNSCALRHNLEETLRSIRGRTGTDEVTGIAVMGVTYGEPLPDSIRLSQPTMEQLMQMATVVVDGVRRVRLALVTDISINAYDSCNKHVSIEESMYDMFCLTAPDIAGIQHIAVVVITEPT